MKVFKYLVALADISVGFLGLFFIIFAITRPTLTATMQQKVEMANQIKNLQEHIRQLEEIQLAKTRTGNPLDPQKAASITIGLETIVIAVDGRKERFDSPAAFAAAATTTPWPATVVLYIDQRVPFEKVVRVIDILKQIPTGRDKIAVQIAAINP